MLDNHRAKFVPPEELAALLGSCPRERKVVLCHGVFDVVHPGHIRHLLYAREKADVLVVSITADQYVQKGPRRPHVPQEMRAQSLAVLDFVDYVVISHADDPLEMISLLQPDYYAKGFEYSATARPGHTLREAAVVEGYGGEVLFTPGDFVRSSSALLGQHVPDLRQEKLRLTMERADISFDLLRSVVGGMSEHCVHVVGDLIVDVLLHCSMAGGQAKTPTQSVRRDWSEEFVGGAGAVALHARAAGAKTRLTTVVGADRPAFQAMRELEASGVDVNAVVDDTRPTTVKETVVVDAHRLLKLGTVDDRAVSGERLDRICAAIRETVKGALIFSDFRHGIFNARSLPQLMKARYLGTQPEAVIVHAADSQVASRWGNITDFRGFDLVTPNEREARFALADQDSGLRPLASRLYDEVKCRWLLMKVGERGLVGCSGPDHEDPSSHFSLDSFAGEVRDPVGAGDALLAYATLSLCVRPCPVTAGILGSMAAAVECESDGNVPVSPARVLEKIDEAERELS